MNWKFPLLAGVAAVAACVPSCTGFSFSKGGNTIYHPTTADVERLESQWGVPPKPAHAPSPSPGGLAVPAPAPTGGPAISPAPTQTLGTPAMTPGAPAMTPGTPAIAPGAPATNLGGAPPSGTGTLDLAQPLLPASPPAGPVLPASPSSTQSLLR